MQLSLLAGYARPGDAPLRYFGGKWALFSWINGAIEKYFPGHASYIEPFGGGYAVGFCKRLVDSQVYADINPETIQFFSVLQREPTSLIRRIEGYAAEWGREAYEALEPEDRLGKAACCYLRAKTSWCGGGCRNDTGVSPDRIKFEFTEKHIESLLIAADRLQQVQIRRCKAASVIRLHDDSDSLIYVDPPYLHKARRSKDKRHKNGAPRRQYAHEMSESEHIKLALLLRSLRAGVIISGFDSPLYDSLYDGWRKIKHPASAECLWIKQSRHCEQLNLCALLQKLHQSNSQLASEIS